ncbi:MAG: putative lipid II flippase FtsW [Verrucomicrobiota bacterium]
MKAATTVLVFCVGALLALGMVTLYSASMTKGGTYLLMQLVWAVIGIVACTTAASIDYRHLEKFAWALLGLGIGLLALVLVVGKDINGARRWFDLKVMHFQPSEFAKVALIIALACYGERYQRSMGTFRRGFVVPGIMIGVTVVLIFAGRDYGTTMLLGAVSVAMLLVAGVLWRFILPSGIAVAGLLALAIINNPVRLARVMAWLNPDAHSEGVGYQARQAMFALGSGGWTGLGLGNGRQKLGWVPEHHTDFILSVIGEELGLVATLGIVIAFVVILICGVYIAWNARDMFGQLLATGITTLITLQAFINIGVVTSTLPNKGLPLPFISYGGSNLLMMLACVGLLLSVARHSAEQTTSEIDSLEEGPVPQPAR